LGGDTKAHEGKAREADVPEAGTASFCSHQPPSHFHVARSTKYRPFSQQFTEPNGSWDRSYYYTNFEIVYMPFFRGQQYQSFFQDLDSTDGFYAHRWGDAPIRLLGLAMYAQQEQVKLLDLPYSHKVIPRRLVPTSTCSYSPFSGVRQCCLPNHRVESSSVICDPTAAYQIRRKSRKLTVFALAAVPWGVKELRALFKV
jgi:hypothetical protein